ncbi:pyrE: orotate phosphoribosyltransferase [Rubrobacter radiotolerans]|uniref:Orotate phosphoribosyltransferase n=1 Tax=Rubrobacter radiotolerans TaxID=42256 RepID=A0A023X150_RUBRA|nr:orotate phosphoribosyltransferase [Rubrobacter radiotolerans]AHY45794.1 pyrE: orotate phosphoribosyltransferase [Rubrobacter radiotolerans]MDX5893209.1 orotate phosphoribosyltransferase [Rubrobacter radiotolerans]SMC03273.1 orotate phosphoribosyltransferase [Rubrobacter radiotolerans DSM 5868]
MAPPEGLAARVAQAALLEGDFLLSSGKRSSFYVDKYLFSTEPKLLREIASAFGEALPQEVDLLAGVELGAVPLVVAVALGEGKPYVIARKGEKEYGTAKGIEGRFSPGQRVALLEDVVTTGTQAVAAAERLERAGLRVAGIFAVLDRREDRTQRRLGGFPFEALLTLEELRVEKGI